MYLSRTTSLSLQAPPTVFAGAIANIAWTRNTTDPQKFFLGLRKADDPNNTVLSVGFGGADNTGTSSGQIAMQMPATLAEEYENLYT